MSKNQGVRRSFLLVALVLALIALVLLLISAQRAFAGPIGPHRVDFAGAEYSEKNVNPLFTKLTYTVTAGSSVISAWVLEIPDCIEQDDVLDASEAWSWVSGPIRGVKFTEGYAAGETRQVWMKIKGHWKAPCPANVGLWGTCTTNYWASTGDGMCCEPPTAIEISSFSAHSSPGSEEEQNLTALAAIAILLAFAAAWFIGGFLRKLFIPKR